jgi:hypothetical protein
MGEDEEAEEASRTHYCSTVDLLFRIKVARE